jgi:CRISPR-associated protein Cmr4
MFKDATVMFLYTETPLHAGSGSSVSYVDLPIQRERHTQYPMVQASGVKGAVRDTCEERLRVPPIKRRREELNRKEKQGGLSTEETNERDGLEKELAELLAQIEPVFGPDPDSDRAHEYGGAIAFTDARILLFPVRSLAGVFAWVTCPTAIQRFKRDLQKITGVPDKTNLERDYNVPQGGALVMQREANGTESKVKVDADKVVLEDFAFTVEESQSVNKLADWLSDHAFPKPEPSKGEENRAAPPANAQRGDPYRFWTDRLKTNLVVLDDAAFRDFVEFSTQVDTHIRIGEKGTVAEGALWTEESLPPETLLYSLVLATDPRRNDTTITDAASVLATAQSWMKEAPILQFGGNETTGQGIVKATFLAKVTDSAGKQGGENDAVAAQKA